MALEHIGVLRSDPHNARKHTPRNIGLIASAMNEVGAARSIVIDEENRILAGSGTVDAAAQAGIERLLIVDADGETIVAVRRSGLTPRQKVRLALLDNRASELASWDGGALIDIINDDREGDILDNLFYPDEIIRILNRAEREAKEDLNGLGTTSAAEWRNRTPIDARVVRCPNCGFAFSPGEDRVPDRGEGEEGGGGEREDVPA